jgi:lipopolysaccharide assembly outer membrane protein LptD (OstA)
VDPADTSSITRILGNANDMEKERHGVFLRSTGKKAVDVTEVSLKAMIDYYINMGTYLGLDLTVPQTKILNPTTLSLGIGFTRTISEYPGGYSPYYRNNAFDGSYDWNSSNFFAYQVPFRYRFEFKSAFSGKYGSLSWEFPYYSDPYVNKDFLNRAESVDWVNIMDDPTTDFTRNNDLPTYRWFLNGSLNPSFPSLAPYISRISLSTISTTLQFKSIEDEQIRDRYSSPTNSPPNRYFYGPDLYTIYNFSASITGTPVTIGGQKQNTDKDAATAQIDDPLEGIGTPVPPWIKTTIRRKGYYPMILFPLRS